MSDRAAYVDYQQRASEFAVGDIVYPFMSGNSDNSGRVMAVYPAIGMCDVEWPHGSERMAVEDLQQYEAKDYRPPEVGHDNVPGGAESVTVPGGPTKLPHKSASVDMDESSLRVAHAFVKRSIYWGARNRKYRATKAEIDSGRFGCPKCRDESSRLRKVNYKRNDMGSEHLLGCPHCLFVIKRCDLIGHPDYIDPAADELRLAHEARLTGPGEHKVIPTREVKGEIQFWANLGGLDLTEKRWVENKLRNPNLLHSTVLEMADLIEGSAWRSEDEIKDAAETANDLRQLVR